MGNSTILCSQCLRDRPEHENAVICTTCVDNLRDRIRRQDTQLSQLTTTAVNDSEDKTRLQKERDTALQILHEDCGYSIGEIFHAMQNKMEE